MNPVRSRHCDRSGPDREPDTHRRRFLNDTGADLPGEGGRASMDISAELAEISSYKGFFALTVGGDAAGWHPVRQSYADGFADLIDATVKRYHTTDAADRRLAGPPRPCHPTVVTRAGVRPGPRRRSRPQRPATRRRRGAAAHARTHRSGRRQHLGGACCTALWCDSICSRSRPACGSSWRLPCWRATLRPRWSARRGRCSRRGPTCAARSSRSPTRCWTPACYPDPA